ncbi:hypothetical protein E2320_002467 [Naja naja]|nr:hypothetical protein E2320_002467 [Naja naja]
MCPSHWLRSSTGGETAQEAESWCTRRGPNQLSALQEAQFTLAWAEHTTVFEWRAMRPLDFSESRKWGIQPPSRSQNLEGLPKRFGQLSISSLGQHPPGGQPVLILAQLTFTFPSQGNMTAQSGDSSSFHSVQSGSRLSFPCWA